MQRIFQQKYPSPLLVFVAAAVVVGVIGIDNFVVATAFIIVGVSGAIIVLLIAVVVVIEVQCKYVNELGHYLSPISHPRIAIIYRAVSYGTHVLRHCY